MLIKLSSQLQPLSLHFCGVVGNTKTWISSSLFMISSRNHWSKTSLKKLSKDELIEELLKTQNKLTMVEKNFQICAGLRLGAVSPKKRAINTDFMQCNYRHIALKVVYLGWKFDGLQRVPNSCNTIEAMLVAALRKCRLVGQDLPVRFTRAGRTDKRVSSFCQVLSLLVRTKHWEGQHVVKWYDPYIPQNKLKNHSENVEDKSNENKPEHNESGEKISYNLETSDLGSTDNEYDYVRMLNSILPSEIRVIDWAPIMKLFSARHNCRKRTYHYYFWKQNLDIAKMCEAAKLLCGQHDFRNFCSLSKTPTVFVRKILSFEFTKVTDEVLGEEVYCAKICATSFLYHQVRLMMTILFLIGMGKEDVGLITQLLDVKNNPSRPMYVAAQAYPLVLYESDIDNLEWVGKPQGYLRNAMFFRMEWSKMFLQTCILKDLVLMLEWQSKPLHDGQDQTSGKLQSRSVPCGKMQRACSINSKNYVPVMERMVCKNPKEKYTDWKENFVSKRWLETQARLGNQD